jgi:hypothetical protein
MLRPDEAAVFPALSHRTHCFLYRVFAQTRAAVDSPRLTEPSKPTGRARETAPSAIISEEK